MLEQCQVMVPAMEAEVILEVQISVTALNRRLVYTAR